MERRIVETKLSVYTFDELTDQHKLLIEKAKEQVEKAYAPYSNFYVGAAVELENGAFFAASNQENAAYPSGLCAERAAMFYANGQFPNTPVRTIAITAFTNGEFLKNPVTPCGACRQVLLESETRFDNEITVLLYGSEETYLIENVKQLLPLCFEKNSLNK
jgi:cytidine deaminase